MPPRTCLRCEVVIASGSLCAAHKRAETKIRNDDRKIRRAVVEASPVCLCTDGCPWHGAVCGSTSALTADHVIPLARGGTNEGQRRTLCNPCNARKGAGRRATTA